MYLADFRLKFTAARNGRVVFEPGICGQKACIVPGEFILLSGVTKTYDEFHSEISIANKTPVFLLTCRFFYD